MEKGGLSTRYMSIVMYHYEIRRDVKEIIDLAVMKGVPVHFGTKSDLDQLSKGMCHQVLFLFC